MLRFILPASAANAFACPNCGLVHRYLRTARHRRSEIFCDCDAEIVFAEEIVAEVIDSTPTALEK